MLVRSFNLKKFAVALAVSFLPAAAALIVVPDFGGVYSSLVLPPFAPPAIVFPIVWTTIYILNAVSAYMISFGEGRLKKGALKLFYIQQVLNFLWPVFFFAFGLYWAALAIIVGMWLLGIVILWRFLQINRLAAGLFLPYVLWISFAAYLNTATAILN